MHIPNLVMYFLLALLNRHYNYKVNSVFEGENRVALLDGETILFLVFLKVCVRRAMQGAIHFTRGRYNIGALSTLSLDETGDNNWHSLSFSLSISNRLFE